MKDILKSMKGRLLRIVIGLFLFLVAFVLSSLEFSLLSRIAFLLTLIVAGGEVFLDAIRGILRRDLLDEKFLMSVASIGAMIIGEWSEGAAVMLFFLVGETFENISVRRSRNSIRSLMDICPDEASVLVDGVEEVVDAEEVEVGSTVVVRAGERIPIDSLVISGSADVDTSALTGESLPRSVRVGDSAPSGVVVMNGFLTLKTVRRSDESAAARILALVEGASEAKSREENFITRFSRVYTPSVVISALLIAVLLPVFGLTTLSESVYRALIFLVISCPCALVISVPMAFFGGIGGAASHGILFKGGNVFSRVAHADTIALDKTGTLTTGKFSVTSVETIDFDRDELIKLVASAEYVSNHPIARSITALADTLITPERSEEIAGEGVIATIDSREVAVGNSALMERVGITSVNSSLASVFVSVDGRLAGIITVGDEIKPESAEALNALSALGVKRSVILSGDRRSNVEALSKKLSVTAAHTELSPEQKFSRLESLIEESHGGVMYVGDGINDSPALARADVGIAMGGIGQDSAIEASDLVIMTDNLMRIPEAKIIAGETLKIAKQNIVFALSVKLLVMLLGALGFANMWLAVFADVGVAVLAILNSMRALVLPKTAEKRIKANCNLQ